MSDEPETAPDPTVAVYDRKAVDFAKMIEGWHDPCLEPFIAAIPKGGHVLDLGCGPGVSAARMARDGLRVTATDASAEMVRLAAAQPGVTALQATFDEIGGDRLYDGIWANFSLLHAPQSAFPRHLAALHRAAKPGAQLLLRMKLGSGEGHDSLGRFYAYYSREELEAHLGVAGFTVLSHVLGIDKGLEGKPEQWIAIAARA